MCKVNEAIITDKFPQPTMKEIWAVIQVERLFAKLELHPICVLPTTTASLISWNYKIHDCYIIRVKSALEHVLKISENAKFEESIKNLN